VENGYPEQENDRRRGRRRSHRRHCAARCERDGGAEQHRGHGCGWGSGLDVISGGLDIGKSVYEIITYAVEQKQNRPGYVKSLMEGTFHKVDEKYNVPIINTGNQRHRLAAMAVTAAAMGINSCDLSNKLDELRAWDTNDKYNMIVWKASASASNDFQGVISSGEDEDVQVLLEDLHRNWAFYGSFTRDGETVHFRQH
jgi:hypothetical protein